MAANPMFSAELAVFEAHRKEWVASNAGEYVVIQGDVVAGFFRDYADAVKAGLKRFGVQHEFLVKQVSLNEPVYLVS